MLLLLPVGALALSATPAMAQYGAYRHGHGHGCGGCGSYYPQPVPLPQPVPSCGGYYGGGGLFGGFFGGGGYGCPVVTQPVPVYVVNQGPVYSGPNIAIAPGPYVGYGPQEPYPYVSPGYGGGYYGGGYSSGGYYGGGYVQPYPRWRVRYSSRYRFQHRPHYQPRPIYRPRPYYRPQPHGQLRPMPYPQRPYRPVRYRG
jgi:hypothetical protein